MGKIIISTALILIFSADLKSQNRNYAQKVIDTLSSPNFFGRGYLKQGDKNAAEYIRAQMDSMGLKPLCPDYFHLFTLNVNTFPEEPKIWTDGKTLKAGEDFLPFPGSGSLDITSLKTIWVDEHMLSSRRKYRKLLKGKPGNTVFIIDTLPAGSLMKDRRSALIKARKGSLIEIVPKLTWSVSMTVSGPSGFQVLPGKIGKEEKISAHLRNEFKRDYLSRNVAAYIKGKEHPDSFIVFTAHYDHLGGMGDSIYIPGANDNASGIAMMLDMASEFATNQPDYSVAFIAFGGEEAGLVGSYYWVKKSTSLLPLNQIRFLINMDLMGSGDEGIMAVNGSVFKEEFGLLSSLNLEHQYLSQVKERGKAANSDHYFFTESGVRAFFFYLIGNYRHYHDINDNADNLKLGTFYDRSYQLIRDFALKLME